MKRILFTLALLTATAASASEWPLAEMNRAIEQTNFIVGGGCSGTLISVPEKLILTNYHCIDANVTVADREVTDKNGIVHKIEIRRYSDVPVVQNNYDGYTLVGASSYVSEIVAEDKKVDLAVLRIKGNILQTYASPLLPDGAKLTRGERVYVVGNPAMKDNTVVEGIISNLNRTFEFDWTGNEKLPMIQFSGGIFGGNSGGALYNGKGELIGVPAAGLMQATFIGLAVPVSVVRAFLTHNCLMADATCVKEKAKYSKMDD